MLNEPLYGVTVSDGYADYLDISLTHNRPQLDRCVVVTSPEDTESQRVAGKHACELVISGDGRRSQEDRFNKGALVERGLQQLPNDGYRVHFDSDIVFPGNMRRRLGIRIRDKTALYGVDRLNVVGENEYLRLLNSGIINRGFEHHHFLSYPYGGCELGGRLIIDDQGWVPIGFFQLWHASVEMSGVYRTLTYPTGSNSAAHDDVQFALKWDTNKRILIPDFFVYHLITPDCRHGINWSGRKTAKFMPFKSGEYVCGPMKNVDSASSSLSQSPTL